MLSEIEILFIDSFIKLKLLFQRLNAKTLHSRLYFLISQEISTLSDSLIRQKLFKWVSKLSGHRNSDYFPISVHRNRDFVSAKFLCTEIVILCQFLCTETDI